MLRGYIFTQLLMDFSARSVIYVVNIFLFANCLPVSSARLDIANGYADIPTRFRPPRLARYMAASARSMKPAKLSCAQYSLAPRLIVTGR